MQITEIRLFVCDEPRLKATLSLTFSGVFVVKGVKIIDGRQGMFVAMPSRKTEGGFEDICHPVTPEFRDYLEDEVLKAYAEQTATPLEVILARRRRSPAGGREGQHAHPAHPDVVPPHDAGDEPERSGDHGASPPDDAPRSRPESRPEGDRSGERDSYPSV